jgi:hypothetical protein
MREVQDIHGTAGYAYNRLSFGALNPPRLPVDARFVSAPQPFESAGIRIYKSSDSAVCPQTWKPDLISRSSNSNSSQKFWLSVPSPSLEQISCAGLHGHLSSNGRTGVAVSSPAISQRCKLGDK